MRRRLPPHLVGVIVSFKSILAVSAWLAATVVASLSGALPAGARDWTFHALEPPSNYTGEVGLRFWYGKAKTGKNLYDPSGSSLVSRLTYDNLSIFSAEAYGRFDLNTGWFLKGLVGGGGFRKGTLMDEDFPPGITPYSATLSTLDDSFPFYTTVDAGYNVLRGPDFRVGAFVGYNYLREVVSADGCGQIATNPFICGIFSVPGTIKVITQDNNWNSLRVGLDGEVDITKQLKLSLDGAWLPKVWLNGTDAHWLRISRQSGRFQRPGPRGWHRLGLSARRGLVLSGDRRHYCRRRRPLLAHADQWEQSFRRSRQRCSGVPATGRLEERQLRGVSSDRSQVRALSAHQQQLANRSQIDAMERLLRAVVNSWNGLRFAFRSEAAFRQELAVFVPAVPLAFFITEDGWKRLALIGVLMLLFVVELLNTAIEKLSDRVNLEIDPQIGRVKDMGSAAVGLTLIMAGAVWLLALAERFHWL